MALLVAAGAAGCVETPPSNDGTDASRAADRVGVYDATTGTFFLRYPAGDALSFVFGSPSLQPLAADWDGDGVATVAVYDARTGGCRDGVHIDRMNENQGAESTLSFLTALAEMRAADRVAPQLVPGAP